MANDPPKTSAPAQPTVADMMELVRSMQANIAEMGKVMGESIQKGVRESVAMMVMAREQADLNMTNARSARKVLGAACHKCRMPVNVCGGPEMKDEPVLDAKGEPVLKDGKPVTRRVEAKKSNEEDANHVKMVVLPDNPAAARWFQFIAINGTKFVSRRRGHAILVPRKNDFAAMLSAFTNFETDFATPRKIRFDQGKRWAPNPLHFAGRGSPMSRARMVS